MNRAKHFGITHYETQDLKIRLRLCKMEQNATHCHHHSDINGTRVGCESWYSMDRTFFALNDSRLLKT